MNGERTLVSTREAITLGRWIAVLCTLGLWLLWWLARVYTVTDRRVIVRRGLIFRSEQSVLLTKVQDVIVNKGPLIAHVRLSSAGGSLGFENIGPLRPWRADRFAQAIMAAQQAPQTAQPAPAPSPTTVSSVSRGQASMQSAPAGQFSEDGRWRWDGAQWVPAAPSPGPTASGGDHVERLRQLAELKTQGHLSEAEFEAEKAKLLRS
jgi:hypothetical protein